MKFIYRSNNELIHSKGPWKRHKYINKEKADGYVRYFYSSYGTPDEIVKKTGLIGDLLGKDEERMMMLKKKELDDAEANLKSVRSDFHHDAATGWYAKKSSEKVSKAWDRRDDAEEEYRSAVYAYNQTPIAKMGDAIRSGLNFIKNLFGVH